MRQSQRQYHKENYMEKYSRGWRGAPAKGVGRLRGARVQIPLSPLFLFDIVLFLLRKKSKKENKKLLTMIGWHDNIVKLTRETEMFLKGQQKIILKSCWQSALFLVRYKSCWTAEKKKNKKVVDKHLALW